MKITSSRRAAAFLLLTIGCAHPSAPGAVRGEHAVRFLLANDVYVADTLADGQGGLARVAALRSRLREGGPILFVLAGDVLSPSLLSKYYRGEQMLEAFNASG
ncbi:MAG: bifunctional metallophosphatase/5'-nucleotidase, partial [Gemmatimonadota bacterium]